METNDSFWNAIDRIVSESKIIIDRPKGAVHPKFSDFIYRVDSVSYTHLDVYKRQGYSWPTEFLLYLRQKPDFRIYYKPGWSSQKESSSPSGCPPPTDLCDNWKEACKYL